MTAGDLQLAGMSALIERRYSHYLLLEAVDILVERVIQTSPVDLTK